MIAAISETEQFGSGADPDALIATVSVDSSAYDVATISNADDVYVLTADSVKVISRSHDIVSTFPVGPHSKGLMPSADGTHVYVASYDGALTIIATADNTAKNLVVDQSIAEVVSGDGQCIYLAHNGTVGDERGTWISVIGCDGTAVALLAVENYVTDLALGPDGDRLYAASSERSTYYQYPRGTVSVIDAERHEVIDVIDMPLAPDTVTVSADGSRLYVTHFDTDAISIIDLVTRHVDSIGLDDAPIGVTVSPDSTFAYVIGLHSVAFVDTTTRAVDTLPIGDLPRHIQVSGDGKHAYVVDFGHQEVWVLDTVDNSVVATAGVTSQSGAVALSADDELLYVADYWDGTVAVISTGLMRPGAQGRD